MARRILYALALGLVAVACSGDDGSESADSPGPGPAVAPPTGGVVIGVAMAATGRWAGIETLLVEAIEAQVAAVNDGGGAGGELLDLRVVDTTSTPDGAVVAARALVDQSARLLFVGCDAETASAAASVGQETGVVVVSPCASAARFSAQEIGELVFTLAVDNEAQGVALADYAFELGVRRVVLVSEVEAADSSEVCAAFGRRHGDLGATVAADVRIGEGGTPAEGVAVSLSRFNGVEMIVACVAPPTFEVVAGQAAELGVPLVGAITASAAETPPGVVTMLPSPQGWDAMGVAAVEAVVVAVDRAGSFEATEVAAALAAFAGEQLTIGDFTFAADQGPAPSPLWLRTTDGTVVERPAVTVAGG